MTYSLLDSGCFEKLEKFGPYILCRPAPQAVWQKEESKSLWQQADARFIRNEKGLGSWHVTKKNFPKEWLSQWKGLKIFFRLTSFGHVGLFPEHQLKSPWLNILQEARKVRKPFRLLNLFAYTGLASCHAALSGAKVTHVDASKTSIEWAKRNAQASLVPSDSVRWLLDDVRKFCQREKRRNSFYNGVILDPPTFGRGFKQEVWNIDDHLPELLLDISNLILKDQRGFVFLSSHSPHYSPQVLENLLRSTLDMKNIFFDSFEMTIPKEKSKLHLPCGSGSLCSW